MNFRIARRHDDVEINFVPLIDVLIVLLIFLMVTTTFSHLGRLKVDLPQAAAQDEPDLAGTIHLSISASGDYQVNDEPIPVGDAAGLGRALQAARGGRDDARVVLGADRRTPHERVIAALEAARGAGIFRVSFAVSALGEAAVAAPEVPAPIPSRE